MISRYHWMGFQGVLLDLMFETIELKSLLPLSLTLSLQAFTAEQLARTDTIIYGEVEASTREDKITGARKLNIVSDE